MEKIIIQAIISNVAVKQRNKVYGSSCSTLQFVHSGWDWATQKIIILKLLKNICC